MQAEEPSPLRATPMSKRVRLEEPGQSICQPQASRARLQDDPQRGMCTSLPLGGDASASDRISQDDSLDANGSDDSGIRQFLISRDKIFMARFLEHTSNVHKVMADMRSEVAGMRVELCALKTQVEVMMLKGDVEDACNGGATGNRADKSNLCDASLPHFTLVFTQEVIFKVVFASIVHTMSTNCSLCNAHTAISGRCDMYCIGKNVSTHVAAMLFGKKANMGKAVLQVGIGKEHCNLKRFLVLSLIVNAQQNSFGQFEIVQPSIILAGAVVSGNNSGARDRNVRGAVHSDQQGRFPQPRWIKPNMISSAHIDRIRTRMETKMDKAKSVQSKKRANDANPSDDDISLRCVDRLYRKVTSYLHGGRDRGRATFFDELGYVLVSWVEHSVPIHIKNPILEWAHPNAAVAISNISSVPQTFVPHSTECFRSGYDNGVLLSDFLKKSLDMVLFVEHGVQVSRCVEDSRTEAPSHFQSMETSGGPETRVVRRMINLVDVSLKVLNAYCGGSLDTPISDMLSRHKDVMRAAFAMAVLLKTVVTAVISSRNQRSNDTIDSNASAGVGYSSFRCDDVSLLDLLPTPSMRHKTFLKMVLAMAEGDYAVHHVPRVHDPHEDVGRASGDTDGRSTGTLSDDDIEGHDFVLCG